MDKVKLNKHFIWDILEIDWSKVKVTFNGKVINLPKSITVRLWDKFKVRQMMGNQPLLFHLMLKQGFNWFTLTQEDQEADEVYINLKQKLYFSEKMAREISPICNFIFGSICTGLPMDTVDVELMIRTVKGIYTYRKDNMAKSTVFSPWSRTVIPFPSLCKKVQAFQDENRQMSAWNKGHATSYFSAPPQPKCRCTLGKTRTRWSNWRNCFNPIKTKQYNT